MRLWTRILQVSSRAFSEVSPKIASKVNWQRLGRRRLTPPDADVGLIREMVANGTPMSLASLKAALDATASSQDVKWSDTHRMKSLALPTIESSFSIFAG